MSEAINTHGLVIDFGKHKGTLWTRVPVSYLKWLANQVDTNRSTAPAIARAELARRGTTTPSIEVSGHAIDRASLRLRKLWHETAKDDNEGLNSWLIRMAEEALAASVPLPIGETLTVEHRGVKWVFALGEMYPTLLSVMSA